MRLQRCVPLVAIGIFCGYAAAQDLLTPKVSGELRTECNDEHKFIICANALSLHGLGKDELALQTLSETEVPEVRKHYQIATSLPDDGFWKLVARAGAQLPNCQSELALTLGRHFDFDPQALASAADDSSKSVFTALSDLLGSLSAVPLAGLPRSAPVNTRNQEADVYRYCFFSDSAGLFAAVKKTLGR